MLTGSGHSARAQSSSAAASAPSGTVVDRLVQDALGDNLRLKQECISLEQRRAALAEEAEMSPYHFCRQFKKSTGQSPYQYVIERRVEEGKRLLEETEQLVRAGGLRGRVRQPEPVHAAVQKARRHHAGGVPQRAFLTRMAATTDNAEQRPARPRLWSSSEVKKCVT